MLADSEIAKSAKLRNIKSVAESAGILEDELVLYGNYKAKVKPSIYERLACKPDGKLVLVTAVNPTPAGEGKTTVAIGLTQALNVVGKKAVLSLREPSLGPVFGIKGGATGGGYSQIVPMDEINLHFTGDIHAITAANNLLCAVVDNHIYQGNQLGIDPERILINRCLDINDRALRNIRIDSSGKLSGNSRNGGFVITVATEIMAILCLATDLGDLRLRLGNILVAFSKNNTPVYAKDLKIVGSLLALLKDAFNPNLVQTLEGTLTVVHGGPFANIAHGCSSVRATRLALKLSDYCITEAGFGSDLGGEKFFDIKCRLTGLKPSAVVLVVTARAIKYNGGVNGLDELKLKNMDALRNGVCNLAKHIENLKQFNVPTVVAVNKFYTDSDEELEFIKTFCKELGVESSIVSAHTDGGSGSVDLARKVVEASSSTVPEFSPIYSLNETLEEKIEKISRRIYGASKVEYTEKALQTLKNLKLFEEINTLPVCIAKTQYSLSDDKNLLGAPNSFAVTVRDLKPCFGAGFVIVYMGNIVTMPGLSKFPAAELIDVDEKGKTIGIF